MIRKRCVRSVVWYSEVFLDLSGLGEGMLKSRRLPVSSVANVSGTASCSHDMTYLAAGSNQIPELLWILKRKILLASS
jgi:hypothetical protein